MASIYKRFNPAGDVVSPFWWVKFRDPKKGRIVRQSTGFLHGNGADTRRAREFEAQKTLAERQCVTTNRAERWDSWVLQFIEDRYKRKSGSKTRYAAAWRTLSMWLDDLDIVTPRHLTYLHCSGYVNWREKPDKQNGKYAAGHNTAVLEMKFMALVMQEAVRRGYAQGNPCRDLGLEREKRKLFPQYSDADIQLIVDAIHKEPERKRAFLWPSFLVAYYHGVRLMETNVNPMRDVQLARAADPGCRVGSITFHQKGGKVRMKPLHPELLPLFQTLIGKKSSVTFDRPKSFAKEWFNFLNRCGMKAIKPAACFHSFRVTVQNRLRRAGVPKEIRKAYLSHDSMEDVNEMYDRIDDDVNVDEMLACHAPLNKTWVLR